MQLDNLAYLPQIWELWKVKSELNSVFRIDIYLNWKCNKIIELQHFKLWPLFWSALLTCQPDQSNCAVDKIQQQALSDCIRPILIEIIFALCGRTGFLYVCVVCGVFHFVLCCLLYHICHTGYKNINKYVCVVFTFLTGL